LRKHYPALGSLENISLKICPRIPFWWIPGNRNVQGLTLWNTIYITSSQCPVDLLDRRIVSLIFHELIHVEQFQRHPLLFPLVYVWGHLRYGYWNNPAEVEARERSAGLIRMWEVQAISTKS
jgi:hypothetical protein